jgi:hypothetical protein
MAGVKFSQQIDKELKEFGAKASAAVTGAAKSAWKVAVENTPRDTGLLQHSWKLSRDRRSSYVPKPGKHSKPSVPDFNFRITKDKKVYLYNNVPYASYVENGEGPGNRTPSRALLRATIQFEKELDRRLRAIK